MINSNFRVGLDGLFCKLILSCYKARRNEMFILKISPFTNISNKMHDSFVLLIKAQILRLYKYLLYMKKSNKHCLSNESIIVYC